VYAVIKCQLGRRVNTRYSWTRLVVVTMGGLIQKNIRIDGMPEGKCPPDSIKRLDSVWLKFYIA